MTNEQALMAGRTAAIAGKEWDACPVFEKRDQDTYWRIGWREGVLERLSNAEFDNDTLRAERDRLREALWQILVEAELREGKNFVNGLVASISPDVRSVVHAALAALEDQPASTEG